MQILYLKNSLVFCVIFSLAFSSVLNTVLGWKVFSKIWLGGSVGPQKFLAARGRIAITTVNSTTKQYGQGFTDWSDWNALYPAGGGYLYVDGGYYMVSMYHQIRCLNEFRDFLTEFRFNAWTNSSAETLALRRERVLHCLSYLRRMTMCEMDVTLEPGRMLTLEDGGKVYFADGRSVTHECRTDWTETRSWVEHNQNKYGVV